MIKKYQPDCLVNSRIGNGIGDYRSCGDNQVDFKIEEGRPYAIAVGERTGLFECPATLNDTWGYKSFDNNWKPASRVREIRDRLNSQGVNYLLNIGPDYLGRLPPPRSTYCMSLVSDAHGASAEPNTLRRACPLRILISRRVCTV